MKRVASPGVESCVWMAAGLVSYKLCDRDFDCARCPLDAALHGGAPTSDGDGVPDDRRHGDDHLWVATGCRPYRDGWLFDVIPARHLVEDETSLGPCMADGGEPLTSLSDILGGAMYFRILREVSR